MCVMDQHWVYAKGYHMYGYKWQLSSVAKFQRTGPKGAVIVMVAVLLVVLLGCVALAVDIGHLYVARAELQRTADAAALAGAQALGRSSSDSAFGDYYQSSEEIYGEAVKYASLNAAVGQGVVLNLASDVRIGYLQFPHDLSASLQTTALDQANAVQVIARRNANTGGKIPLFFAPLWGINSSSVGASAIAVLDDRFSGYAPQSSGGPVIPFSLDVQIWNDQIVNRNGPDEYGYNSDSKEVLISPDGRPEVKLFPDKVFEEGEEGAGNFGIVHIGPGEGALGTSVIVEQINNGISGDDLVSLTGKPMIDFYHQVSGEPVVYDAVSYDILANPGLAVGLKDAMEAKIGKVVGFFLHNAVSEEGANTVFHIVGMRFGRVMEVDILGGGKAIVIQPAPYYGPEIITSPYVDSTDRTIGRLELVR